MFEDALKIVDKMENQTLQSKGSLLQNSSLFLFHLGSEVRKQCILLSEPYDTYRQIYKSIDKDSLTKKDSEHS